jgi:sialic acid synthase SpsE
MGAKVLEKHFTFDKASFGVDHDASISPEELQDLVRGIRHIEAAIGTSVKTIPEIEKEIQKVHRPSIVSKSGITKGTVITRDMLDIKKPGTGIHPQSMDWVVGRKAKRNIEIDRLIKREDLE